MYSSIQEIQYVFFYGVYGGFCQGHGLRMSGFVFVEDFFLAEVGIWAQNDYGLSFVVGFFSFCFEIVFSPLWIFWSIRVFFIFRVLLRPLLPLVGVLRALFLRILRSAGVLLSHFVNKNLYKIIIEVYIYRGTFQNIRFVWVLGFFP